MIRHFIRTATRTIGFIVGLGVGSSVAGEPPSLNRLNRQFVTYDKPWRPRPVGFYDGDGNRLDLSRFHGRVVLLNFWATWCPPCVWEMPALDYLQKRSGGRNFEVVAVSLNRMGITVVAPFFRKHNLKNLRIYTDRENRLGNLAGKGDRHAPFVLFGLPVTYVIDRSGLVRGYVIGALKWKAPPATAFVRHFICETAACGRQDDKAQ